MPIRDDKRSRCRTIRTDRPDPAQIVSVLLASPHGADHRYFQSLFDHTNWKLFHSYTVEEASALLEERTIPVVVADEGHAGSWKRVLDTIAGMNEPSKLIVIPRNVDHQLWAEVLNLGGFDLLPKPWEGSEISRLLSHAWLTWKHDRERLNARLLRVAGSAA